MAHNYLVDLMNMDAEDLLDNMIKYTPKKPNKLYAVKRKLNNNVHDINWPDSRVTIQVFNNIDTCKMWIESNKNRAKYNNGEYLEYYIEEFKKEV